MCSLPSEEIEIDPEPGWLSKHLGFVGDPNQINVGITRAKEGLCIIGKILIAMLKAQSFYGAYNSRSFCPLKGNQALLNCSRGWRNLLAHYRRHNAMTDAHKINVLVVHSWTNPSFIKDWISVSSRRTEQHDSRKHVLFVVTFDLLFLQFYSIFEVFDITFDVFCFSLLLNINRKSYNF